MPNTSPLDLRAEELQKLGYPGLGSNVQSCKNLKADLQGRAARGEHLSPEETLVLGILDAMERDASSAGA